jgi:hypothetical protein
MSERKVVDASTGHGGEPGIFYRRCSLAIGVPAPTDESVSAKRKGMVVARSDGGKAAVWERDVALTEAVFAPGDDGPVSSQRQAMEIAHGHCDKDMIGVRHIALAMVIPPGRDNGAVAPKGEPVSTAAGNGNEPAVWIRDFALVFIVQAPSDD